jgi:hypothetical protein
VDAFFASIARKAEYEEYDYDLLIDFNKIIPVAANDEDTDWRKRNIRAWGTKGCYYFGQHKRDDYTIVFLAAWVGVPGLMLELSRQNPELYLFYTCDLGLEYQYSIGTFLFYNGEILLEECYERGTELYEIFRKDLYPDGESSDEFLNPVINKTRKCELEERDRANKLEQ